MTDRERELVQTMNRVVANDMMKPIGSAIWRGKKLVINRDHNGKFWVEINGFVKQRRLTAEEIVRYLLNAMDGK